MNFKSTFFTLIATFSVTLFVYAQVNQSATIVIDNRLLDKQLSKIVYFEKWNEIYISLNDFVEKTGFGIYTNEPRQKSVLYIANDKATFTADNNYVILNDHIYQLTYTPQWRNDALWVPVNMLVDLFNQYTAQTFSFDRKELIFTLGMKNVNISGVAIESKDNGTLIKVLSTKKFSKKDVSLKVTNNWLHIDIFGGKADPNIIKKTKPSGIIKEIDVIEFDQIISLAFRLNGKLLSRELVLEDGSTNFVVNLRTNEKIETDKNARADLEKQREDWLIDTIVIDAGHGGKDPGAIGAGGLKEKDITLAVAIKLGQMIEKNLPGTKVIYTRNSDVFIPLWQRTKIANEKKGKLFISLHCNSNNNKKVKGFETYFLSADKDKNQQAQEVVLKENASIKFEHEEDQQRYEGINFILATMAQSAFIRQSQYFASTIQNACSRLLKPLGIDDRGVKQGRFWVMVGATMPNVLVEMGFVSNTTEANFMKKNSSQMKIAQAIFEGIKKYKTDIEASI
jgi:N-acetylmuramoyl-L-alanine amidase